MLKELEYRVFQRPFYFNGNYCIHINMYINKTYRYFAVVSTSITSSSPVYVCFCYTDPNEASKVNGMVLLVFGSVIKYMASYDEEWANRMTRKLENVLQIHGKVYYHTPM